MYYMIINILAYGPSHLVILVIHFINIRQSH